MAKQHVQKEIRYEIKLIEDIYGMYDLKYDKGIQMKFDRETKDAYILDSRHEADLVIPKSKAIKIKITKFWWIEIEEMK